MKVLIQTVGTGGPNNPVWEALAFVVREKRPDVLVQLCSEKTKKETIPKFDKCLAPEFQPRDTRPKDWNDPDDVEDLTIQYSQLIDDLRKEFSDAIIESDFTSGTKAMSAALVAASVSRRIPYLHYAVGPRDRGGRANKTERIITINSQQLVADRLLNELGRLFNLGQFVAVKEQAESLSRDLTDESLVARAESLAFLSHVYDEWVRFDWRSAFSELREYGKHNCIGTAEWDTDLLRNQVAFLKKVKKQPQDKPPTPERLVDLYANAKRCIEQGRYDDAVARLYRLVEYIGQARLCKHHITKTKQVEVKKLREIAPKYVNTNRKFSTLALFNPVRWFLWIPKYVNPNSKFSTWGQSGKVNLGLRDNIEILKEAKDPVGVFMAKRYGPPNSKDPTKGGPLKGLLDKRNQSLLAHGKEPVQKKVAEDLAIMVASILEEHLDQVYRGEGTVKFREFKKIATFARCPWVKGE